MIHERRGHLLSFALAAAAAAAAAPFVACSTDRAVFDEGPKELADPDAAPPDAPVCGFRCSPDLKKVLRGCDGTEEVVATCGPDRGCGVDRCVDACESAALSKGSTGCAFWTLPPDDTARGSGGCFAALVANTWDRAVTLRAELGTEAVDISRSVYTASRDAAGDAVYTPVSGPLPAGEVGVVFLSQAVAPSDPDAPRCPAGVVPAVSYDPLRHGTGKTVAFHLVADAPIAAYSIYPYGGAESFYPASTMLIPVSSWDKSYVAVSTGKFGSPNEGGELNRRTLQIVADEDDTEVSMRPIADVGAGYQVEAAPKGAPKTWRLRRGEVLQINQFASLSGSPVVTNKPVGLFGGSPCTFLPIEKGACDMTHQQIAPFAQWGHAYALVPYRPRHESPSGVSREVTAWTFVGAVDGTELTWDPAKPPGAPERLSEGEVVDFMTDALASVKSQDAKHPFYAGVQMTGWAFGGRPGGPSGTVLGDPEFVNVVPAEQFLDRYVFFADYTYPETTLTVVRKKTATGFHPVELECAGEIAFTPLGASGEYEYAWMRLTSGSTPQRFEKGTCGYGRHEARSDGPFSITVWGMADAASYGYTGGMGSRPVNEAPPPSVQ
ncbi:MAG: IgGFc-binding protein [Labilithrix sp.]|nr:IgGFc-binding protein [Labilithrix sp.]